MRGNECLKIFYCDNTIGGPWTKRELITCSLNAQYNNNNIMLLWDYGDLEFGLIVSDHSKFQHYTWCAKHPTEKRYTRFVSWMGAHTHCTHITYKNWPLIRGFKSQKKPIYFSNYFENAISTNFNAKIAKRNWPVKRSKMFSECWTSMERFQWNHPALGNLFENSYR